MIKVIPTPKSVIEQEGKTRALPLTVDASIFPNPAQTLCDYVNRIRPASLFCGKKEDMIRLVRQDTLAHGAYRLVINEEKTEIAAGDEAGAFYGVMTLFQLISGDMTVPCLTIDDAPDCEFSSVMIDLGRTWHDFDLLIRYVDVCCFYKINVLHLHFTDNLIYSLPSKAFPLISSPQHTYTPEQIERLRNYATLRGVQLMPEIDLPGHCVAFQTNYADVFGEGGVMRVNETSIAAVRTLFTELCEMFPESKYIHIGGDEVTLEKWLENKEDYGYYRDVIGIDPDSEDKEYVKQRIYAHFVNEAANAVFDAGKQPIAWEGFGECVNDYVRRDLIIISWENYYQTTPQLLKAGYRIINCTWVPLYVCSPNRYWSQREIFQWDLRTWTPIWEKSPYYGSCYKAPKEADPQIIGGGMCIWGDALVHYFTREEWDEGNEEEFNVTATRLAELTENVWNREKITNYNTHMLAYVEQRRKLAAILRR